MKSRCNVKNRKFKVPCVLKQGHEGSHLTDFGLKWEDWSKPIPRSKKSREWSPLKLPSKDCMYQGSLKCSGSCDRIVCDAVGDDVSIEYCLWCRYIAKTYGVKPYRFAEELSKWFTQLDFEKLKVD